MPHSSRRSFLAASAGAALASPLLANVARSPGPLAASAPRKLKLLILGGTGFLGPVIVKHAIERGHSMTLFNRGRTNPEMFEHLEQIQGDRDTGDLSGLDGRQFDAIIDTSAYVPAHVTQAAEKFAKEASHYTLISSVSAYDPEHGSLPLTEGEDPVATVPAEVVAEVKTIRESFREGGRYYGGFKALCEQAAEAAMPGRVANVRPGLIVGPRDNSDRFTWWPVRMDRGGEVLCPSDPDRPIQVIDVRDLGEWVVRCVENQTAGVFNATGFAGEVTMGELLAACKCATSTPVKLTWVTDEAFLAEHQVGPWMELPVWMPESDRIDTDVRKAIAAGLTFRPLGDTIRDTLAWAREEEQRRPMFRRTGIAPEKEQSVLEAWKSR